ncbi:hypothetical protein K3495_g8959 [Podosphaera aphanis]|nr:hypothetical protein K3495_g8959 [Podosphaera aphanis]
MGLGRFVCVALPYALTLSSFFCILTILLSGITNKDFNLFEINTTKLSASVSSLTDITDEIANIHFDNPILKKHPSIVPDEVVKRNFKFPGIVKDPAQIAASAAHNITGADLELADRYKIFVWNYCSISKNNVTCSPVQLNWAAKSLNISALEDRATAAAGTKITLPKELTKAYKSFIRIAQFTQFSYVSAAFNALMMLGFGIYAFYSRVGSCITLGVCSVAALSVIVASVLATIEAVAVTGVINSIGILYGVKAKINLNFLALTWLAVILIVSAGFFWTLTSCCCGANRSSSNSFLNPVDPDPEKAKKNVIYQRMSNASNIDGPNFSYGDPGPSPYSGQQYGDPSTNQRSQRGNAYEPYAHTAI